MKSVRPVCLISIVFGSVIVSLPVKAQQPAPLTPRPNLAVVATASGSNRFGAPLTSLNDGQVPTNQGRGGGGGNNRQPRTMYWVQYEWQQPIVTKEIAVYWWNYNNNLRLPEAYRIKYWDGSNFVPVNNVSGMGMEN